jgi:hypothetical protein
MGDYLMAAAATLPIWRDAVVASLACIVIGALYLYVTLLGES